MIFKNNTYLRLISLLFLSSLLHSIVKGEEFSVASFQRLTTDISGFIDPVNDLNGDPCALLKIQAPPEFVFSTPLGIVKRKDNVGEILLYIPAGSKRITFKHPQWGVLRDYVFPEKILSNATYEVKLIIPERKRSLIEPDTIYTTLRDTLIMTRTDTLIMSKEKQKIPLSIQIIPTIGFGGNSKILNGGIFAAVMKRHGGYMHYSTDFGKIGEIVGSCDRDGATESYTPFYSGNVRHSLNIITVGAIHRLSDAFRIFEGAGYGNTSIAWELAASEGGGFIKNTFYSAKGPAVEIGCIYSHKRLSAEASLITINGKEWYGCIGVGINIGKL